MNDPQSRFRSPPPEGAPAGSGRPSASGMDMSCGLKAGRLSPEQYEQNFGDAHPPLDAQRRP